LLAQRFKDWKTRFIEQAAGRGYDRASVSALISPAKINEKALDRDSKQPEFSRPIWTYVDGAASADRLAKGKSKLAAHRADFDFITARYPVERNILTAIWGLESAYGRIQGDHNIIDALATFAFEGRRQKFGAEQLYAVLDMLRAGDIRADQLTGSWAGAMGMTQFIPATFRDYAVDMDGDGNKNLWGSEQDALGSAAHYLARHGWALGITSLASGYKGQTLISTPWPRSDDPLSYSDKKAMQRKLTSLGYNTGGVDGKIGPNTRKAIRAWQASQGLPADGYMEQGLFKRLTAK